METAYQAAIILVTSLATGCATLAAIKVELKYITRDTDKNIKDIEALTVKLNTFPGCKLACND